MLSEAQLVIQEYSTGWMESVAQHTIPRFSFVSFQQDLVSDCLFAKRVAALFSRQTGKTTTISLFSLFYAMHKSNRRICIFAPAERQSTEMFSRIVGFAQHPLVKPHIVKQTATEIVFDNGSYIRCLPVGHDGSKVRGGTYDLIIIEESGHMKQSIFSSALLPMVGATNGNIIQIGTPGPKNHFYEAFHNPTTSYRVHINDYMKAIATGLITEKFIEDARSSMTEQQFQEEYGCRFQDAINAYFDRALVEQAIDTSLPIKNMEINREYQYYLGCDVAGQGKDLTVLCVLAYDPAKNTTKVWHIESYDKITVPNIARRVATLHEYFKFKKVSVDQTGIGQGPVDIMREQVGNVVNGVMFTLESKMNMYSNLKMWLEKELLTLPPHQKLKYELLDMQYEKTAANKIKLHHSEGGHDDFPDALVLALSPLRFKQKKTWDVAGV